MVIYMEPNRPSRFQKQFLLVKQAKIILFVTSFLPVSAELIMQTLFHWLDKSVEKHYLICSDNV